MIETGTVTKMKIKKIIKPFINLAGRRFKKNKQRAQETKPVTHSPPVNPLKTSPAVLNDLRQRDFSHLLKDKKEVYLEVGAENKKGKDGWITIDLSKKCDIQWDLRNGIPFPTETISKIYSSHFLEHLTYKDGQTFLDECMRVLVPGGVFSVCVPNAGIYIKAYLNTDPVKDLDPAFFIYKPAYNYTTKIDYINYMAYMDGHHKYMFDEENLVHILKAKGFENVHLRKFDPELDLKKRDYESIYAEGIKKQS